jgi:peptide maturation system protein (TIGR04066 family)
MVFGVEDKILVYPVDRESLPVIKSTANYPSVRICRLVSPESWGYEGEIFICADGTVKVTSNYEKELDSCSAVWIVDSWNDLDFCKFIEPAIRLASEKDKRVVCTRKLSVSEKESLSDIDVNYVDYSSFAPTTGRDDRVKEIRTPVALVLSNTDCCNQFYVETALCAKLRQKSYEAILISSRKESATLGLFAVPDFMFRGEYSENEKIIALNQYIRHLEMEHQPEIIIIGVPGAAMPYNHQYSPDFGVLAYEISEAVKSDFAIFSKELKRV